MKRTLKLLIRNITKFKLYSILNVTGLSIGLASVIFIFLWIFNELNYDKFNANFNNIYQINFETKSGERWDGSPAPLAPAIIDHVPGIITATRILKNRDLAFSSGDKMFYEKSGIISDPEIFDIFSFNTIAGDPKEALNTVESMVVTKSFAHKYFGDEDPINKQLNLEGQGYLTIKAVIDDVPSQSHLQFDYILSFKLAVAYQICGMEWGDPNFVTYIRVQENANAESVLSAITQIAVDNKLPHIVYENNTFNLRPLKDIYLDHDIESEMGETGDIRKVIVFGSVGLLILLLACINYINLSVSLFSKRQKSSSIHKICGALRKEIFIQYLSETLILILVSLLVALGLVVLLKPIFSSFIGKGIDTAISDFPIVLFIISVFLGTVLLCGIYPSFLLSGQKSSKLFEKFTGKKSNNRGLKLMVGIQNVISILLIICTIGIFKQMNFIRKKDLGFKTEQIIYVSLRGNVSTNINAVKEKLSAYAGISQISFKDCEPFSKRNTTSGIRWKENGEVKNDGKGNNFYSETTRIDPEYLSMMGVEFVQGRNFDKNMESEKQNYILNEEAVRRMGLSDPIGEEFALYGQWGRIVGVIKDTYFKSLHEAVEPQVFYPFKDLEKESNFGIMYLKVFGNNIPEIVSSLQNIWVEYNPDIPF